VSDDLPELVFDGPEESRLTYAFAHGAGAPMDSPFMNAVTFGLAAAGYRVVRFEFPYMAERRQTGAKKPPNGQPVLLDTWTAVIDELGAEDLVIGGKSMGGRMASLLADEAGVAGLVCLGYPFHPPGKPEKVRTEHLATLKTPTLICQGTRDALGDETDVAGYDLSNAIRLHWLPDGDHSLKPRKRSGHTEEENLESAVRAIADFLGTL
jgi:uncharacterized protein